MIAGFETRAHVLAQLAALEREKSSGHMNARWLEAIESQERLFRAELESLGGVTTRSLILTRQLARSPMSAGTGVG